MSQVMAAAFLKAAKFLQINWLPDMSAGMEIEELNLSEELVANGGSNSIQNESMITSSSIM